MRINSATATLIGAALAYLGVLTAAWLSQSNATNLADRRARADLVLEMLRSNSREQMLQKMRILSASGLLPDKDSRLLKAVSDAPAIAFREVMVPTPAPCAEADDIPRELTPLGKLPDNSTRALAVVAARDLELRQQNSTMRAMLLGCTSERFARPDKRLP